MVPMDLSISNNDYIMKIAGRKLSKPELKFCRNRIYSWQDYVKNIRYGKLGFNKKLLSKVNWEDIVRKCIEVNFKVQVYEEWLLQKKEWDEFVSKN